VTAFFLLVKITVG